VFASTLDVEVVFVFDMALGLKTKVHVDMFRSVRVIFETDQIPLGAQTREEG